MFYVLTEGWYDECTVKGVTQDYQMAHLWAESGKYREWCGPFADEFPEEEED